MKQVERDKAVYEVTQFGNINRKFIVKNPKKIEFWKSIADADGRGVITKIRRIKWINQKKIK